MPGRGLRRLRRPRRARAHRRPAAVLTGATAAVGIDVGGTKLLAVGVDTDDGAVLARVLDPTPRGAASLLDGMADAARRVGAEASLDDAAPVGIGMAGLVDHAGVLRHGPNQPGAGEVDVLGGLRERLGDRVVVDNDGNCALRAEVADGAAQGAAHAVLVTFGTGIGAGLLVDGRIVRGHNGMAGEPGHTMVDPTGPPCPCGRRGCWERYASGAGVARMARDAAEAGRLDGVLAVVGGEAGAIRSEDVVAATRDGDDEAAAVMADFAWWAAVGVANLAATLDPEVVVLGGGLIDAADLWLDATRSHLAGLLVAADHRTLPRIESAHHGADAAAIGAARLAACG